MTDKNKPAFSGETQERYFIGITAQEYAAIHLKVPDSGTPWLDEMIEKSRRDEFAKSTITMMRGVGEVGWELGAFNAYELAAAMLAASKGES